MLASRVGTAIPTQAPQRRRRRRKDRRAWAPGIADFSTPSSYSHSKAALKVHLQLEGVAAWERAQPALMGL